MNVLFIGDIVRTSGVKAVAQVLKDLVKEYSIDFVIANGENADGPGILPETAKSLFGFGINVITTGNHSWKKQYNEQMDELKPFILRPVNIPGNRTMEGVVVASVSGKDVKVLVANISGKINMENEYIENPFTCVDNIIAEHKDQSNCVIVDFHAQDTYEKSVMAYYLDGKVSAVIGSHTHIGTVDARVLPDGTAFVTDIGMAGPSNGVLGVAYEPVIERHLKQIPTKFTEGEGPVTFNSVVIEIDEATTLAKRIDRIDRTIDV